MTYIPGAGATSPGGASGDVQYNNAGAFGGLSSTGTGNVVRATSPALTAPTGIVKGDVGLGNVDNTSDASKPVSTAQQTALDLKAPLASPSLTTPTLGVATATSVNKVALTAPATAATLTIANNKTLTANNSLTLAGTDSTTHTFPSTTSSVARIDAAQTFVGVHDFGNVRSGGATGSAGGSAIIGTWNSNAGYVEFRRSNGHVDNGYAVLTNGSTQTFINGPAAGSTIFFRIGNSASSVATVTTDTFNQLRGQRVNRTAVAANYTQLLSDYIIGVTSTAAPRTITLIASSNYSAANPGVIVVKDESGGAAANNITIDGNGAETINGAATLVINTNYGVAVLYNNGTGWFTF
jgi:hypothetical protein